MATNSEGTVNNELARVLQRKHPRWPGSIGVEQHHVFQEVALQPDIVVQRPGMAPVVLETEFTPARTVVADARSRIGKRLKDSRYQVEQALAVQLPAELREGAANLAQRVESAGYRWRVLSMGLASAGGPTLEPPSGEASRDVREWPQGGWIEGSVDEVATAIERLELSERVIAQCLGILEQGVNDAASMLRGDALAGFPDGLRRMAHVLQQEDSEQTSRMAMAIIANALTFHMAIAGSQGIPELSDLRDELGGIDKLRLLAAWERILREVNYWPIFKIAIDLLGPMRSVVAATILNRLAEVASQLARVGATSLHDLSGRMFQRLIADRKFLATFYTLPNSATLLAEIAVGRVKADWADPARIARIRIADLACGTGALLGAAYQGVLIRHRRAGGDDAQLHSAMMERALVAADIMPAATHLTASTLSAAHPGVTFADTQIFTMPYGHPPEGTGRLNAIGSLDLIDPDRTRALFGTGERQTRGDREDRGGSELNLPQSSVDLVIMNPPFTRPTNHESTTVPVPSFAGFGTSADEQKAMASRLKAMRHGLGGLVGHGNAGLASNFVDLAHRKAKPGGIVALVLPATFTQGSSWRNARRLFETEYRDVVIVSIATDRHVGVAFSADTGMAEVLVVATKKERQDRGQEVPSPALFVNLARRPRNQLEAHEIARQVGLISPGAPSGRIRVGGSAEAGTYLWSPLEGNGSALLREPALADTLRPLQTGRLCLRPYRQELVVPTVPLGALGQRGLLHRDISGRESDSPGTPRGPFEIVAARSVARFPVLWTHEAHRERCLVVAPNREGEIREGCKERAMDVWERTATRLHFNLDFRLNSQSLAACITPEPSIGGRAWPNFRLANEQWEEAVALWANSTLGLMSFWWIGSRQQLGRARLSISSLPRLLALDPRQLAEAQVSKAKALFREFRDRPFKPANEAYRCETRRALDRAVLVDLLGLSDSMLEPLDILRNEWCGEPTVHAGKSTRFPGQG